MTVEFSTLENGMRIVTQQMPNLESVSLGVWVNVGARIEAQHEHGISHFLEHMAFKGTPTRSAREIAEQIESVGGDLNAATSLDTTSYYARVLKGDVPLAIEILADILQNPSFDSKEIEREKEVVLQEIAASEDSPDDLVFDLAHEAAWPAQSVGRPILGTPESVQRLSADVLRAYMKQHYTSSNMVVAAAGAVGHNQLIDEVNKVFANLEQNKNSSYKEADYHGGMRHLEKNFEQSHMLIAFEGIPYSHEDYYIAQVFSSIFGGGMSSRLFQEVREARGLCYSIYSFCWGMRDTGLFGIHAATSSQHIPELVGVIVQQLKQMASEGPREQELARAKAQLKAGLLMSQESTSSRAEQLARQVIAYGTPLKNEELIERVESVTAESIRLFVGRMINNASPVCSAVGNMGRFKSYNWLKEQFDTSK